MDEKHSILRENLAAYALGALDPEETAALERHLQGCESCRAELADYQRIGSGLLAALPARPPRAAVKRALQTQLAGRMHRSRPQFNWSLGQLAFAGLVVLLVGVNLLSAFQLYALRREQAEMINRSTSEQT